MWLKQLLNRSWLYSLAGSSNLLRGLQIAGARDRADKCVRHESEEVAVYPLGQGAAPDSRAAYRAREAGEALMPLGG